MDSCQTWWTRLIGVMSVLRVASSTGAAVLVTIAFTGLAASDRTPSIEPVCAIELVEVSAATGERRLLLRVHNDGRVEACSPTRGGPIVKDQIGRDSAGRLERDIAENLTKLEVSNESLADERKSMSARTGLSASFPDADELVLRLQSEGRTREIRCRAVELLAERFPDARLHQALRSTHERLLNVIAIAQAGGRQAAEHLAAEATRKLRAEHPAANDWTAEDLSSVRCLPNKSRLIQFRRREARATPSGKEVEHWVTNIIEMPGEPSRVSVVPPDRVTR
jgi:hypothetical protein